MVAPDTPYHSTKFQPYTPSQSKVIPTHVNSTYTPSWPKTHPWKLPHWLPQVHPLIYVPIKHCLKILIINQDMVT